MKAVPMMLAALLSLATATHQLAAQTADGASIYKEECKSCHGVNGVPPARALSKYEKIRTLGDSGFVSKLSADSIVTVLTKGIDKNMKSFKDKLTEAEITAVAAYIKELADKKKPGA